MATSIKDILTNKNYPRNIKEHAVFKNIKSISKVFPEIGLPNCEKEITIDNSKEKRAAAMLLLREIKETVKVRNTKIAKWEKAREEKLSVERKEKIENCELVLKTVQQHLTKSQKSFCKENEGKLTLNLPKAIEDKNGKVIFKTGERLLGVYNKLNELLTGTKLLPMKKIEEFPLFKKFSSTNVPSNKMLVRFSSDGTEGVWDIATMSMRGISSCQTWGQGNATHVVGSMLDPFTGIIYLTTGEKFNEHGSKMIRRCVVRFVVNEKTKKPFLYLERMYPAHDLPTLKMFSDFLTERTDGKFEIKSDASSLAGAYVPMSKVVRDLPTNDQPYRDSGILYKNDINDKKAKIREVIDAKMLRFYSLITNEFRNATHSIKDDDVAKASATGFKAMKGSSYNYDYSYYYYEDIVKMTKGFMQKYDSAKYTDADSLIKDAVASFANSKLDTQVASAIRKTMKSNSIPSTHKKIDVKLIKNIAKIAAENIAKSLKAESEKMVVKVATIAASDIPEDVPVYVKLLN